MFAEPSSGSDDRLQPRDIEGMLLIVRPVEYVQGLVTQFTQAGQTTDAIKVNVVNLDEPQPEGYPTVYMGALWFQGRLIGNLKSRIGELLLGRIVRGAAKPGFTAPYIFESATSDQSAVARAQMWLAQNPEFAAPIQNQNQPQRPVSGPPQQRQAQPAQQRQGQQYQQAQQWQTGPASPEQQTTVLDRLARQGQQGGYSPQGSGQAIYTQTDEPPF